MPKFNVQFHATKDEIMEYILKSIKDYNLNVILPKHFPVFGYKVYNSSNISLDVMCEADDIILTVETPVIGSENWLQLLRDNKGFLIVQIGEEDDFKLQESRFAGTADNEVLKVWKTLINQFKKIMYKGAWVVDVNSGIKKYYKTHMYTVGARKKYEAGNNIYAIAGNAKYMLDNSQI